MIDLRPETEGDLDALCEIVVATRRPAMDAAGLPADLVAQVLTQQYAMQRAGYRAAYPGAAWEVVTVDGAVVGRMVTDTTVDTIALVDIVIAPGRQRQGIGTELLTVLVRRADDTGRTVRLSVDRGSPAEGWYRRHGFDATGSDDLQLHMVRRPVVAAAMGRIDENA
jgi:ribosomal protein S18 acetylase RimI-like enzyme